MCSIPGLEIAASITRWTGSRVPAQKVMRRLRNSRGQSRSPLSWKPSVWIIFGLLWTVWHSRPRLCKMLTASMIVHRRRRGPQSEPVLHALGWRRLACEIIGLIASMAKCRPFVRRDETDKIATNSNYGIHGAAEISEIRPRLGNEPGSGLVWRCSGVHQEQQDRKFCFAWALCRAGICPGGLHLLHSGLSTFDSRSWEAPALGRENSLEDHCSRLDHWRIVGFKCS